MSMSKKQFIALANVIREFNRESTRPFTVAQIAALCTFCKEQNSRFMEERFMGYIAGTNGPNGGAVKS